MEEGSQPLSDIKSINLSLQIIVTILTIIKLFMNFYEPLDYTVFLIIDIILNFLLLILVNIIPILLYKEEYEIANGLGIILEAWMALNIFIGVYELSSFESKDFKGIYNFLFFGRIALVAGFIGTCDFHENRDYFD